jgi:hypothetical protein
VGVRRGGVMRRRVRVRTLMLMTLARRLIRQRASW